MKAASTMRRWMQLAVAATALAATPVIAQSLQASGLSPFRAHYAVALDGKEQGKSTISLERIDAGRWRYSVSAEGTRGMARFAGFEADDVTEFEVNEGNLRILTMRSRSHALFKTRDVTADFDWVAGKANWQGDLKSDRREPTALTGRAVNGSLLNLLLAMDARGAADAQVFHYQMLDRGSDKQVEYVAGAVSSVSVPAGQFEGRAMRRDRADKDRVVTAWYAEGLPPTPIRLLQQDAGKDKYELRLLNVE